MSADNTILVIKTKRTALEIAKGVWQNGNENYVYRVAHVQAADNLSYYKTKEELNRDMEDQFDELYFGTS